MTVFPDTAAQHGREQIEELLVVYPLFEVAPQEPMIDLVERLIN